MAELGDAVTRGETDGARAREVADLANADANFAAEAAACALAMICIHDARETGAGLNDLQARVLALPDDAFAVQHSPSRSASLRVTQAWAGLGRVIAALYSGPSVVKLDDTSEACLTTLTQVDDPTPRLTLTFARYMLGVGEVGGSNSWLGRIDALAEAAMSLAGDADRHARDEWYAERAMVAAFAFTAGRIDEAQLRQHIDQGSGVGPRQRFKIARAELLRIAQVESLPRQREALEALRLTLIPDQVVAWVVYLRQLADFLVRCDELPEAEAAAAEAVQLAGRISAHAPLQVTCLVTLASSQGLQGRLIEAAANYDRASQLALAGHATLIGGWRDVSRAIAQADRDGAAARQSLSDGLSALRGAAAFNFLSVAPRLAARACALALDFDIEAEYVRSVIARRKMAVPFAHARAWPWTLRIQLFGGFRCDWSLDGDGEGKARNKPAKRLLGLLKWLAHVGPDGIDRRTLIRRLWPGEAAEEQSAAFDMALARLRKVLPDATLIVGDKGMLRLDRERVWVDAWAFTSLCEHVDTNLSAEPLPRPDVLLYWAGEINRLVVGRYLDGEEDGAAMEVVAEQLRERFVNNQEQLAEALARYDLAAARDLLARALEREPYAEQLYRAMMRLQLRAGDYAEVVRTYRRCQTAISKAYGVALASQTQAILAELPKPVKAL